MAQLEDDLVQAADADPTPPIHTYVSRRAGGQGGSRFVWQLRVVRCPFQHRQPGEGGGVGGVSVRARTRSSASGLHWKGLCAKCGELREGADNNQVGFNSVIERY